MKARKGGFTLVELLIVIMIIAILAGMMLLATGSATDSAEATKIINDLRNVKSASLLYYADNNEWPGGITGVANCTTSLEPYMDRAFDTKRYDDVQVGTEVTTGTFEGKQFIGFGLKATIATTGITNKLAKKAADAGVYGDDAGGTFAAGGTEVWMNMK